MQVPAHVTDKMHTMLVEYADELMANLAGRSRSTSTNPREAAARTESLPSLEDR
jgi:hypothetical protein